MELIHYTKVLYLTLDRTQCPDCEKRVANLAHHRRTVHHNCIKIKYSGLVPIKITVFWLSGKFTCPGCSYTSTDSSNFQVCQKYIYILSTWIPLDSWWKVPEPSNSDKPWCNRPWWQQQQWWRLPAGDPRGCWWRQGDPSRGWRGPDNPEFSQPNVPCAMGGGYFPGYWHGEIWLCH